MNVEKNYYQTLGLNKNSTQEEIKKTYKKLAIKFHPDKNKGDKSKEDKFKEISEAYSIIGDVNKKKLYDVQSKHGKSHNPNPFSAFGGSTGFDDIFNTFFGGSPSSSPFGSRTQHEYREFAENLDITINVIITLQDVYKSKPIPVKFKRFLHCDNCKGSGFDPKSDSYDCDMCGGKGKDRFGRPCDYCQGQGKIFSGTCPTCKGEKVILKDTEFNLNNIHKIRKSTTEYLRGYGHQSKYYRQKKGDLKLKIIYQSVKNYSIQDEQLYYNLDLHYKDAISGVKFKYEALDGTKIKVTIPKKTNDGDKNRLKGKGLLKNVKDRGDLIFIINIIIDYDKLK